jgi:hypothetical protein
LKPNTLFFFFSNFFCINLGQPAGKGWEKEKTLVLTLGSLSEKGRKKKEKTLVLTLGRTPDLDFRT